VNAAQLLAHFDRISEAPDAVPRLRRFILDLAVRGKLVPQDPRDEPAEDLLKRIQGEMTRAANAGTARKGKSLPAVAPDEAPYVVPGGWSWARVRQVTSDRGQLLPKADFTYIDVTAINKDLGRLAETKIYSPGEAPSRARKVVQKGDVLYSCVRPYLLNVAVIEEEIVPAPVASTAFAVLNGFGLVLSKYIWIALRSPSMVETVEAKMRGQAYPAINDSDFAMLPLPIPPFAEQQRIVAKVDELMALCDRLEAAQAGREGRRDRLVVASLQRLSQLNDPSDAEGMRQDARFYLQNLSRLTTRREHVRQARDAILVLAVTGRLSPGRPSSGKSDASLLHGPDVSAPLPSLPDTWAWTIVDRVAAKDENAITDGPFGANLKTSHYVTAPGYRVVRLQNIGSGHFRDEHRSYIDKEHFERLSKHRVFAGDLVVAGLVDPLVRCCEVPPSVGPAVVKADCYRLKVGPGFSSRYMLYYINSPVFQRFAAAHHHGMTLVRIGLGNFRQIPVPAPPLAEQHRIVAKVDELLALCDRFEGQLEAARRESGRLLEAVLQQTLSAAA